jgi:hypothetical protein
LASSPLSRDDVRCDKRRRLASSSESWASLSLLRRRRLEVMAFGSNLPRLLVLLLLASIVVLDPVARRDG